MSDFKYFEIGDRVINEMNAENKKPKKFSKRKHHLVVKVDQEPCGNPMDLPKGGIFR